MRTAKSVRAPVRAAVDACLETEYKVIHDQRLSQIRSYNYWYGFGHVVAHAYFWLVLLLSFNLGSRPMLFAAAFVASLIVWFAYRVILTIDRDVVRLYPRIVFLELVLGYDFYRDYLRRSPRGETERAFVERCEAIKASSDDDLWQQMYNVFKEQDFPADRRITGHFKPAAYFSVGLFWLVVAVILIPLYLPWN
jgi:hypothetical protein